MTKATIIRPSRVQPLVCSPKYTSRMLLDHTNSESKKIHVNHGTLKAGENLLPSSKHGELGEGHDEVYIMLKGNCRIEMDGEFFDIEAGDVIHIPGGVYHGLDNTDGTEDIELLTVWAGVPPAGINEAYDLRLEKWGKSYKTVDEA